MEERVTKERKSVPKKKEPVKQSLKARDVDAKRRRKPRAEKDAERRRSQERLRNCKERPDSREAQKKSGSGGGAQVFIPWCK